MKQFIAIVKYLNSLIVTYNQALECLEN